MILFSHLANFVLKEINVIDCPTEKMWADVMTNPLQGTAFRVMRAELMNCDINYEDPPEDDNLGSIPALKTVSWKYVISTTFKTPQECVGQNRNLGTVRRGDTRRMPERNQRGTTQNSDVASWSVQRVRRKGVESRARAYLF